LLVLKAPNPLVQISVIFFSYFQIFLYTLIVCCIPLYRLLTLFLIHSSIVCIFSHPTPLATRCCAPWHSSKSRTKSTSNAPRYIFTYSHIHMYTYTHTHTHTHTPAAACRCDRMSCVLALVKILWNSDEEYT